MTERMIDLRIEDVVGGLRNHGYLVTAKPVKGHELEYLEDMRDAMQKVDSAVDFLHKHARCRGLSARTLRLLHIHLPEPGWGVTAPMTPAEIRRWKVE